MRASNFFAMILQILWYLAWLWNSNIIFKNGGDNPVDGF